MALKNLNGSEINLNLLFNLTFNLKWNLHQLASKITQI